MSWIQKLHESYPNCVNVATNLGVAPPWPISHFVKKAHVEVVIDDTGNLKRVRKLEWDESSTLIPATESSAGRTAGITPHPLCEELGYCARDLPTRYIDEFISCVTVTKRWADDVSKIDTPNETSKWITTLISELKKLGSWCDGADNNLSDDDASDSEKAPKIAAIANLVLDINKATSNFLATPTLSDGFDDNAMKLVRKFNLYMRQLRSWAESDCSHIKVKALLAYLQKGSLWGDLDAAQMFPVVSTNASSQKTKLDDDKVFVRLRVESLGDPCSGTWEDIGLVDAWIKFDAKNNRRVGFDMVTGQSARIAQNHSKFIRFPGDGAKLISANDFGGYTFRGRFTDSKDDYEKQVCSVGYEVSQKAHNALRWLIEKQGYRNDDQAIVSWAVSGAAVPDPFASTLDLFGITAVVEPTTVADTAQSFALRLKKAIAGYSSKLDPTDDIVVMGLDSATPGRMAIAFYRELKGSEFLERIQTWHAKCAWPQNFGKESKFVGAPAPRDIAEAAYGRWDERRKRVAVDDKLLKAIVERLLPCIIDAREIPNDLVVSVCRRATNRVAFKKTEADYEEQWEKCLGIACALFRGYHTDRSYQMAIEADRITRDYLYGRLLAIADSIEGYALYLTEEGKKRETTAARLMQRFADRPFSTWRNIELALGPYKSRLQAGSEKSAGFLAKRMRLLDEIATTLDSIEQRTSDVPLTGEFLLGYHCQRQALRPGGVTAVSEDDIVEDSVTDSTSSN
jgi:CRISPR-associated protein Csd1